MLQGFAAAAAVSAAAQQQQQQRVLLLEGLSPCGEQQTLKGVALVLPATQQQQSMQGPPHPAS